MRLILEQGSNPVRILIESKKKTGSKKNMYTKHSLALHRFRYYFYLHMYRYTCMLSIYMYQCTSESLCDAVSKKDTGLLIRLLAFSTQTELNQGSGARNDTPLHIAAHKGDLVSLQVN